MIDTGFGVEIEVVEKYLTIRNNLAKEEMTI
jgi:hypothetical protein